jgi:hypothetical protein
VAFSISHDHRAVRIYGHYPVIDGKDTSYYRHPIHTFDFTALDGKDKWTAYKFTKNVYDYLDACSLQRLAKAIDDIPPDLDFSVPPLQRDSGLSRDIHGRHLSETSEIDPWLSEGSSQYGLTPMEHDAQLS